MNIIYDELNRVFALETENAGYYMAVVDKDNFLTHIHYGKKLSIDDCLPHLLRIDEYPHIPSKNNRDRLSFYDSTRWEYPCGGIGDFRESALEVSNSLGQRAVNLSYESYKIIKGKPALEGLPATWGNEDDCMTLEIKCQDTVLNLEVFLYYSIFRGIDAVVRSARICNRGSVPLTIKKAYSVSLDMENDGYDMITLHGSWARERHIERRPLFHGKTAVSSIRGETSHQEHSFMALAAHNADYDKGEVWGFNFIYSGNFTSTASVDQFNTVRAQMGINSEGFSWRLEGGESFQTPEAVIVYTADGFNEMSHNFHNLFRNHLIRGEYRDKMRPILINNWEATYFDFDTDKLLDIAREASKDGIEMLVMDDGWFGHRNNDESSLGDWFVNEEKLKGGLKNLVDKVNSLGMKFGIWFEPEMISPESELYKAHPDWALKVEDRRAGLARFQYVLDMGRKDVRDYTFNQVAGILKSANIEYVKWDMNRPLADVGSAVFQKERAGEIYHRYVLGVYELQERLVGEFPHLLLENCSGGGGRFDAAMLYYSPQIWCSDDTDAIERLEIQEGTALMYPLSTMGAHVSVCPNHAIGRVTPFRTRGFVALAGTFGYELDITKLSEQERALVPEQVAMYKKYNPLIRTGDYYRIASYSQNHEWDAWEVVSIDKKEALVTLVQVLNHPSYHSTKVMLKGLSAELKYHVTIEDSFGKTSDEGIWTGLTLMNGGFLAPRMWGDFHSQLIHLLATDKV